MHKSPRLGIDCQDLQGYLTPRLGTGFQDLFSGAALGTGTIAASGERRGHLQASGHAVQGALREDPHLKAPVHTHTVIYCTVGDGSIASHLPALE
jgi:hypothetical protein